jgi:thiol-disulfide isomerase/thioredoxin
MLNDILESLKSSNYNMILFYMTDCGSCIKIRPIVLELAKRNSIPLFEISTDDTDWIKSARHFGITDFPSLLVISKLAGQKVYLGSEKIQRFTTGAQSHFDLLNSK